MILRVQIVAPFARLLGFLAAIAVAFGTSDVTRLLVCWGLATVCLGFLAQLVRVHLIFLVAVVFPIAASSLVINAAGAPAIPSETILQFALVRVSYDHVMDAARVFLKLAITGFALQAFFLPLIQHNALVFALRRLGVSGDSLLVFASSIALVDDIRQRLQRILDAYSARGLLSGGWFRRAARAPQFLSPLVTSVLLTSIARSRSWTNRNILQRIGAWRPAGVGTSVLGTLLTLGVSATALVVTFYPAVRAEEVWRWLAQVPL